MIKIFGDGGEDRVNAGRANVATEQRINQNAADQSVQKNLKRMLIKAGDDFDSSGRVMQLVAETPEKSRFMSKSVPPVIDEGGDEVRDRRSRKIVQLIADSKAGRLRHPPAPRLAREHNDPELN